MDLVDLFKDSLRYPAENRMAWLMIMVICFVNSIFSMALASIEDNIVVTVIVSIIVLIVSLVCAGFSLKVIRSQIDNTEVTTNDMTQLPENITSDLVGGIKVAVVEIVYSLVAFAITFIFTYLSGSWDKIISFISQLLAVGNVDVIPTSQIVSFAYSMIFVVFVGVILAIIVYLLQTTSIVKLAETGSIMDALNIKDVLSRISTVGWGRYIIFKVLLAIILFVAVIVLGIVSMIPYVGGIIADTIVGSYIILMMYASIGKLFAN